MRRRDFLAALAATGVACTTGCGSSAKVDGIEKVLLVSVDTLRADHLGCYGYGRKTSPCIDRLAAEGTLFERVYAQRGLTYPSLASIMTSLYPVQHTVRDNGHELPAEILQLAEVFQDAGYKTAAFLANAIFQKWKGFGYIDRCNWLEQEKKKAGTPCDERITDGAVAWLREHGGDRFFAWVHYISPHWPYRAPEAYRGKYSTAAADLVDGCDESYRAVADPETGALPPEALEQLVAYYDDEVAFIDAQVERLVNALEGAGVLDETLVVVTNDHGDELYEHNNYLWHTASIHEGTLRMPLVFRAPAVVPGGRRVGVVAESLDIAPTLLRWAGLGVPDAFEGVELPFQAGVAPDALGPAFIEWHDRVLSIRNSRFQYIYNKNEFLIETDWIPYPVARHELYDFQSDPRGVRNVADDRDEQVAGLRTRLLQWKEAYSWMWGSGDYQRPYLPGEVEEFMKAMGYGGG